MQVSSLVYVSFAIPAGWPVCFPNQAKMVISNGDHILVGVIRNMKGIPPQHGIFGPVVAGIYSQPRDVTSSSWPMSQCELFFESRLGARNPRLDRHRFAALRAQHLRLHHLLYAGCLLCAGE